MSDKETAPTLPQLALEIRNLAHLGWKDRPNAEFLFREIGKRAQKISELAVECTAPAPQPCGCCSEMLTELVEFTKCPADEDVVEHVKKLLGATPQVTPTHCHADSDGDCEWGGCPQKQKREIYCRLAAGDEDEAEESAEKNTDGRH